MNKDDRLYLHSHQGMPRQDRSLQRERSSGILWATMGKALSRPTLFPIPAFGVRLVFGEIADALLLSIQRVEPSQLEEGRNTFLYPELEATLQKLL